MRLLKSWKIIQRQKLARSKLAATSPIIARNHNGIRKVRHLLSIDSLLKELVSSVEGASGAILLGSDGEAVQWCSSDAPQLRLRSAYVAVVLKSCRATAVRANLSDLSCLVLAYDGARFVAQELDRDCFVVLELSPLANIGEALFRLKPAVERLRIEIEQ